MKMNIDDVEARVQLVQKFSGDNEDAHIEEDKLYLDLLRSIANGVCDNPQLCAAKALETQNFDFGRWFT